MKREIKKHGYEAKKIVVTGGRSAYALFNKEGEVLAFQGNVYLPSGGTRAFLEIIEIGDINAECFSFIDASHLLKY